MTITEQLQASTSEEQVRALLNLGNNHKPSGKTRREWLKIATAKRKELIINGTTGIVGIAS